MLISQWMTHDPVSVQPGTSLAKCQKLLKAHDIRRLPVVDENNCVIGIISDRDVKSASPSKATSLEVHEMQYLLAEVKAKDIMTPNPITVKSNESISTIALLMLDEKIGGLPVVDDDNHLVGVITDQDIFRVLVTIGGARMGGLEITVETTQDPGTLATIFDIIRRHKGRIISVLTAYLDDNKRQVYIRMNTLTDEDQAQQMREELAAAATLLEWNVCKPIPKKAG